MRKALRQWAALSAAVVGVLGSGAGALAAPATWDGDAAVGTPGDNATWANAANWTTGGTPDTAPSDAAPGDDLTFGDGTAGGIIDLGANRVSNSLTFTRNYTLGTAVGTFTLTNTSGAVTISVADTTGTINAPLVGATGLTKTGAGTLVLAGTNTFTGTVAINGGVLSFGGPDANSAATRLGAATNAVSINGGTLRYTGAARFPADASTLNQHNFAIGAAGGTFDTPAGQMEIRNAAGSLTSPAGSVLTKTGVGTLRIASANTGFLGTTTINGGVLEASLNAVGATAVTVNAGGNFAANANTTNPLILNGGTLSPVNGDRTLTAAATVNLADATNGGTIALNDWYADTARSITIPGVISGSGPLNINVSRTTAARTGVAVLTGANTYTGQTNVLTNVLRAASGTGLPNASNLNLNGGVFETTAAAFSRALGTGAGQVQVPGGASGFSSQVAAATVNLGGAAAPVQWGVPEFNPSTFILNAASANNPVTFANPIDLNAAGGTVSRQVGSNANVNNPGTFAGALSNSNGTANLTKVGPGRIILAGTHTYSGTTTISTGILQAKTPTSIPNLATVSVTAGAAFGASVGGAGEYTAADLDNARSTVTFNGASALALDTASGDFTYGSNITNTATPGNALGITKVGANVLTLSGANSYTGTTTVSGGTLAVSADNNLGAPTAPVTINNGGTLRIDGTTLTSNGSHPVNLSGNAGINIADAANNFTLTPPALLNTGIFTKSGPGTLTLNLPAGVNEVDQLHMSGGILDIGAGNLLVNNAGGDTIQGRGNSTINATGGGTITISMAGTTGVNFGDNDADNGITLTINAKITSAAGVPQGFEYCCNNFGTIVLNNPANDFVGNVFLNNSGTISVPGIGAGGSPSPLGRGTTITFDETTNNGPRLLYTGPGEETNRTLAMTTNAMLEQGGTGLLKFTSVLTTPNTTAKTLTLQGSGSGIGELAGGIPASVSILKAGTGTWILSGANASAGTTTINAGTLLANTPAPGSATGTGTVTVNNGGTLGGVGSILGPIIAASGGRISPGMSAGILRVGNTDFADGSNFVVELNGTTVGTQYDQLSVTGTVDLGAPGTGPNLLLTLGYAPAEGDTFTIISNDGADPVVGVFGQGAEVVAGGIPFAINYTGGDGNDVTLTAGVPEPASAGLLALGALGLLARRRRRHPAR